MTLLAILRLVVSTLVVCAMAYPLTVLVVAQVAAPASAEGQLLRNASGQVIGSRQIAQSFTAPHYLWPRPSAADFDGAGAGGSNLAASNPDLAARAAAEVRRFGATAAAPLPQELAAASGAGLDPHITLEGALYQLPRVAAARGVSPDEVRALVAAHSHAPAGPLLATRLVNVLETNLALDAAFPLEARGG
jgi:K+-transporting ATPase ATPase C chain